MIEPATAAHPDLNDRTWRADHDAAGAVVREVQPGGITVVRTYDDLGRLVSEAGSGTGVAAASRSWTFDAASRLVSFSAPGGTQTVAYDDRGLPVTSSGPLGAAALTYDAAGRLPRQEDAAGLT